MEQYIPKAAVVAEIDEIVKVLQKNCNPNPMGNIQECLAAAQIEALNLIKDFLNTLETKEVDLEKEIYDVEKRFGDIDEMGGYRILIFDDEFRDILRHFFELGIKSKVK